MNTLSEAIDRLEMLICDVLGTPRDALQLPPRLREALDELRDAAGDDDEDEDEITVLKDELDGAEYERDELADRLDRLRIALTSNAGLSDWQWRRLPGAIVELLDD
jgi:hypothetical protein